MDKPLNKFTRSQVRRITRGGTEFENIKIKVKGFLENTHGNCPECGESWGYDHEGKQLTRLTAIKHKALNKIILWQCPFCNSAWKKIQMKYEEVKKNIFDLKGYKLAHCISSDLKMGAGIAVPMAKKYKLRNGIANTELCTKHPTCIYCNDVFNLITKSKYYGKPTYDTIREALLKMKELVISNEVDKIAMPKIGCGLDKLQWGMVRDIIHDTFDDLDIEIKVCHL